MPDYFYDNNNMAADAEKEVSDPKIFAVFVGKLFYAAKVLSSNCCFG